MARSSLRSDKFHTMSDHIRFIAQFSSATRQPCRLVLVRATSNRNGKKAHSSGKRRWCARTCAQSAFRYGTDSEGSDRVPPAPQPRRPAPLASAVTPNSRRFKRDGSVGYVETVDLVAKPTRAGWPQQQYRAIQPKNSQTLAALSDGFPSES